MTTNSKAGPLTVVLNELKLGPKGNPVHQIPHQWGPKGTHCTRFLIRGAQGEPTAPDSSSVGPKGNPLHQIPHLWRRHAGQGPVQTQGRGLPSLFAFSNEIFPPLAGNLRMSNIQAIQLSGAQIATEFKSRGQAHKSLPC